MTIVYETYSKDIYLYLYSLSHDHTAAEDLMQDTFYKALLSFGTGQVDIKPWLYRVARNLFIDRCRKSKRNLLTDFDDFAVPDDFNLVQDLIEKERNRRLYAEIQKLPVTEREIVTLYYFCGLRQEEIARQFGISYANVRTLLHRIRRKLYETLKEDEYEL